MNNELGLRSLKAELSSLEWVEMDPKVRAAREAVRAERKPIVDALKKQIAELQAKRPEKKLRWPENTPANILSACERYWGGTTELATFRIHMWNDKAVWTSYPSGGYSDNGGWNPTPVNYDLISLTEKDQFDRKFKVLANIRRRTSEKELRTIMETKTK